MTKGHDCFVFLLDDLNANNDIMNIRFIVTFNADISDRWMAVVAIADIVILAIDYMITDCSGLCLSF